DLLSLILWFYLGSSVFVCGSSMCSRCLCGSFLAVRHQRVGRRPFLASHTSTARPRPPETMSRPSALKHTLVKEGVCPERVMASCPVWASHSLTIRSEPPETMRWPSGLKHTLDTVPECPSKEAIRSPLSASQTCASPRSLKPAALFPLPETIR